MLISTPARPLVSTTFVLWSKSRLATWPDVPQGKSSDRLRFLNRQHFFVQLPPDRLRAAFHFDRCAPAPAFACTSAESGFCAFHRILQFPSATAPFGLHRRRGQYPPETTPRTFQRRGTVHRRPGTVEICVRMKFVSVVNILCPRSGGRCFSPSLKAKGHRERNKFTSGGVVSGPPTVLKCPCEMAVVPGAQAPFGYWPPRG